MPSKKEEFILNLQDYGFDGRGQLIKDWKDDNGQALTSSDRYGLVRFARDQRGFAQFLAAGLGLTATFVLFSYVWPAAKTMMNSTVTAMTTLNYTLVSSLSGLTLGATGTTITLTFPTGATPTNTVSDYTVTVNGTANSVVGVSVSGQTATVTVSNAMASGATVSVTYVNGSTTYTGAGTAA